MADIVVRLNPDVSPTGSDLAVVNAARRSFNTRSSWEYQHDIGLPPMMYLREKDKRLIEFLARGMTAEDFEDFVDDLAWDGKELLLGEIDIDFLGPLVSSLWKWRNTPVHDTPFNHCFLSFEVKAPIFVARQLVKHEYLIMSEFSRRYITDGIEFYEPDYWRKAAPNKKQGSLEEPVETNVGIDYQDSINAFQQLLDYGVAPEQARMVLPQSTMTEWTWSGTLGAFAKMCQLRLHPEAQYESRIVAKAVYKYLQEYYPVSAKALVEGPDV